MFSLSSYKRESFSNKRKALISKSFSNYNSRSPSPLIKNANKNKNKFFINELRKPRSGNPIRFTSFPEGRAENRRDQGEPETEKAMA